MSTHAQNAESNDRRRTGAKIALAALAIGGIGAAVTTAAWTDDVWMTSDASAATFELQGSLDGGTTWSDADDESTALVVDAADLSGLVPGETRTVDVALKNSGTANATLSDAAVDATGDVFAGANPASATIDPLAGTELEPGEETDVALTVVTPDDWSDAYQGDIGSIVVTFTAQS